MPVQQKDYVLSQSEHDKGFVRPLRFSYRHAKCNEVTMMSRPIAETYARTPRFFSSAFCICCRAERPLFEFTWEGTNEVVGT